MLKVRCLKVLITTLLIGLVITSPTDAQPRHRRYGQPAQPVPALVPQAQVDPPCSPDNANIARQHRSLGLNAFEVHDWATCATEYEVAQTHCATPEAGFNLGYCLENSGQLAAAIEHYEQLQSGRLPFEVTAEQIQRTITSVRERLSRIPVAPPPLPPAPPPIVCATPLAVCGGICVNPVADSNNCGVCDYQCALGQSCIHSVCVSPIVHVLPPPVIIPPPPNRTLARTFWIGGIGTTVAGIIMGTVGHLAALDRYTQDAALTAPASERCQSIDGQYQCLTYAPGATRPDSFVGLETPGWILTGVGVVAIITGALLELDHGHTPPHAVVRPTAMFTPSGTASIGLGGTF